MDESWEGMVSSEDCTQSVVGREGISVNNSNSLHNTGPTGKYDVSHVQK